MSDWGRANVIVRAKTRALSVIRRGQRTVLWPDPNINFGNFLYHWLRAHARQSAGEDVVVLRTSAMDRWLPYFPDVERRLVVQRSQVRPTDRRVVGYFQGWGSDYVPRDVEAFTAYLLDTASLDLQPRRDQDERVVVNVRRGDYFSEGFEHRYSFNESEYLHAAMDRALLLGGPASSIHVVSDGIEWCRAHLGWLGDLAPSLTFASSEPTPVNDFVVLATARRLVLTHSTFGYWAAHFSNALYGNNQDQVIVPWFHDRSLAGGWPYHLNPAWTVIRHIQGGWGPEPPEYNTP